MFSRRRLTGKTLTVRLRDAEDEEVLLRLSAGEAELLGNLLGAMDVLGITLTASAACDGASFMLDDIDVEERSDCYGRGIMTEGGHA